MKPFFAVAALLLAAPALAAPSYTLTDLGVLAGDSMSQAYGLNSSGQVVGVSSSDTGLRAFLWSAGTMTDLGLLSGDDIAQAYSINDAGQVVGVSYNLGNNSARAVMWSGGGVTALGGLPGEFSGAVAINNAGQVTGTAIGESVLGYRWQSGSATVLAALAPGGATYGHAINAAGEIAGESEFGSGPDTHAVLYTAGAAIDLGTLPGHWSSNATAVAAGGLVAGTSYGDFSSRAFLWSAGEMIDLGVLADDDSSIANGINDLGLVVGQSTGVASRAFLFDGALHDLGGLVSNLGGWSLENATAINASGQIVGFGVVGGEYRAFLLTPDVAPVPEPGEWAMIATGLLVAGAAARRRKA